MNTLVLRRRLIYISAIAILLVPLYFLGHPSVRDDSGAPLREGGSLAMIRTNYDLNHGDLGTLDPASESARLATLGLRGVAATILWQRAEFYKREKYFDRLAATVNQLRILQPHFVKVWEFQAHNLAWNVSVEFDDYRQRYEWVKKGVFFLIDGSKYNKTRTEMPFELGWAFGNKLGMSDERRYFRELYREDRNFHREVEQLSNLDLTQQSGQGPDGRPDNWRGGALWFNRAYEMVEAGSLPARSPLMFYCKAPQWQYKHAEAVQSEGYLGEEARTAWRLASLGWHGFGQRQIRTTYGTTIFLNELDAAQEQLSRAEAEFQQLAGEVYRQAAAQRRAALTEDQRAVLDKDSELLTLDDLKILDFVRQAAKVSPASLVDQLPMDKRLAALELVNQMRLLATRVDHIERYRSQINFDYWEVRCVAEQDDAALLARSNMYQAEKLLDLGKLQESLEHYDLAWEHWDSLFNRYPTMLIDDAADDVENAINHYLRLKDIPSPPADFPLNDFLAFRRQNNQIQSDSHVVKQLVQWANLHPERSLLRSLNPAASDSGLPNQNETEEETASPRDDDQPGDENGGLPSNPPPGESDQAQIQPQIETASEAQPASSVPPP